jgi:murein L,D-transpeptidase YcbB/YkuD
VVETIAEMRPPVAQYSALREALARYRRTADSVRDWDALPAAPAVVRPGERCEWLPVLYSRLATLADISASAARPSAGDPLDGAVLEGVKRFQARHGLAVDGVVGKATRLALDTPPSSRVRQIELAMERLRWLPHPTDQRVVVLNIPMFRLWALDSGLREAPALSMAVIVGRAIRTETPVMMKEMRSVVFRPYWNVPRSILLNEVLGPLSRDPSSYLARNSMEIVQGAGDDARRVAAVPENLERLRSGSLRLRQRPGPNNSLGLIKFVFPNEADVYMHGTPAQRLFAQSRRDFSHGCVRVEDPVALAEWVLAGMDGWTRDRIVSSMQGEHTFELTLDRPIQVVLLYTTTAVMPEDGTIHFAHDIYREDAALERALGARRGRG